MRIGYFLQSEQSSPEELLDQASKAQDAGFTSLWISDHFHPWNDAQGQSSFVWSVIGALSQRVSLPITTAVTCPTVRTHPAIIAHAAATTAVLLNGRFVLGVGSGEALNEHIFGDRWPITAVRHDMLEEAVDLIRILWTGDMVTHHGPHYTVEKARIYTLPDSPPPIYVSGLGPKAARLAGRIGDGYICTKPSAELVQAFRAAGGGDKPVQGGVKVCWGENADEATRLAYKIWRNEALPGELSQVLPQPRHFEQASSLINPGHVASTFVCGNDVDRHVQVLQQYEQAGFDELHIGQIGPTQQGFFDFYAKHILPAFIGAHR